MKVFFTWWSDYGTSPEQKLKALETGFKHVEKLGTFYRGRGDCTVFHVHRGALLGEHALLGEGRACAMHR